MGSDLEFDLDLELDLSLEREKERFDDDGERLNSTGLVQLLLLVPLADRLRLRDLGRESLTMMIYVLAAQDVLVFQYQYSERKKPKDCVLLSDISTPDRLPTTLRKDRRNELQSNLRRIRRKMDQLLAETKAICYGPTYG